MGSVPPLRPLVTKISRKVSSTVNGSRSQSFGHDSTKSPKASSKGTHILRTLELGKTRQPFSHSSFSKELSFQGDSDGFAILDRSVGDDILLDEELAGIHITTDISVKSEQDKPAQGAFLDNENERDLERSGPLG